MASPGTKMYAVKSSITSTVAHLGVRRADGASPLSTLVYIQRALFVVLDVFSIWAGALFAIGLRFPSPNSGLSPAEKSAVEIHMGFLVLYSGLVVLFANTQHLYSSSVLHSIRKDAAGLLRSTVMAALLLTGFIYLSGNQFVSRQVVGFTITSGLLTMLGWRSLRRRWMRAASADGLTCHNALIVGFDEVALAVRAHLDTHRELGIAVKGFLTNPSSRRTEVSGSLGTIDDLELVARANFIDELIICAQDREIVKSLIGRARDCGIGVRVIPDLYDGLAWGAPIDYLGDIPSMHLHRKHIPAVALLAKRSIDLLFSGIALCLLAPVFAAIAITVKFDSRGPVLYVSRRVGRKGRVFSCYKFRTMVVDADELKAKLQHLNERDGVLFKISNDPRVTPVGRFFRKYSLDELAQLWNVFRGDMSLVGPRPPLADEVQKYQLDHLKRLEVAPGITGLWQVEARTSPSFDRYIELDLKYVRDWNLLLDFKIVLKTIAVVFAGTGQ